MKITYKHVIIECYNVLETRMLFDSLATAYRHGTFSMLYAVDSDLSSPIVIFIDYEINSEEDVNPESMLIEILRICDTLNANSRIAMHTFTYCHKCDTRVITPCPEMDEMYDCWSRLEITEMDNGHFYTINREDSTVKMEMIDEKAKQAKIQMSALLNAN